MRLKILHEIEYRYSKPVSLGPHTFYLKPREDRSQRLLSFDLAIDPAPQRRWNAVDPAGNDSLHALFEGPMDRLRIVAHSEVEVHRPNPFDYTIDPEAAALPARHAPETIEVLKPYLTNPAGMVPVVANFSAAIAGRSESSILLFLPELCRTIFQTFKKIHRPQGQPWESAETLRQGQGSCRDLAMLFMDCCRAQGLAARFASGYFEGEPGRPENELHAWAEVFVRGGGWRGFDPMTGLAVGENYVAVASAAQSDAVSPVIGTFRGGAQSSLDTRVRIQRLQPAADFSL